ncbi:hypothetical protein F2P81_018983 [Scophthalmus maximus]|uniref:Uncharacterized protein n=1 Tax=Scophthalmus maximus TaxID=52904 RepID=A0A6A4SC55_SCOMX|nr:hypothetical protein F2P81_018983 [Scophthalmus maximus]
MYRHARGRGEALRVGGRKQPYLASPLHGSDSSVTEVVIAILSVPVAWCRLERVLGLKQLLVVLLKPQILELLLLIVMLQ